MNANDHDSRLGEAVAYALGALDPGQIDDFKEHLQRCERCQEELRWLAPAVRALPEAVESRTPPPALKERLMAEVRADVEAEAKRARTEERRERDRSGTGLVEWLRGLHIGGLTWKPLAGMALVVLIVAGGIGYAVGTDNTGGGGPHTTEIEPGANGIEAKVVTEGNRAEVRLAGVNKLPKGKVLEAWVQRGNAVEPVPALFVPDHAGNASTTIENIKGVSLVMVTKEPAGGTKVPTEEPFVEVPLES
ncbi:MAG TPA: anti-sigma factor [Solirubrobacterales bacterium]|nr:anti-sigma factor [Solirubrobacterales bacterium]